jgi:hypothetical protein
MNFGKKENKEMIDKSIKDTPFLNGAETKEWMATKMFGMRKKMKKKNVYTMNHVTVSSLVKRTMITAT